MDLYICTRRVRHNGEHCKPGTEIALDKAAAASLLSIGAIATEDGYRAAAGVALAAAGLPLPADVEPRDEGITTGALVAAIATLKPEDFAATGEPKVGPLRTASGLSVTTEERDAAWAAFQKLKTETGNDQS